MKIFVILSLVCISLFAETPMPRPATTTMPVMSPAPATVTSTVTPSPIVTTPPITVAVPPCPGKFRVYMQGGGTSCKTEDDAIQSAQSNCNDWASNNCKPHGGLANFERVFSGYLPPPTGSPVGDLKNGWFTSGWCDGFCECD